MNLRVVTWNCHMALHKKVDRLLSLRPDIAILPECAEPDRLRRQVPEFAFSDYQWAGANPKKGLGIFSSGGLTLRRHDT